MTIGNMEIPGLGLPPLGYSPFAAGPTPASIVTSVFPMTAGAASTAAQIAAALAVAEVGVVRIDVWPTAAQMAAILTTPVSVIPAASVLALAGKVIVPVLWSCQKDVSAVGALNTNVSVEYDDVSWAGFPILTAMNLDTNTARKGQYIGFAPTGLTNTNVGIRSAVGKGIRIIGSADPGNFPATQITARFQILLYVFTPAP